MTNQLKQLSEAATEEAKFLIQKGGAYYRPNSRGYTNSAIQAGRYTLSEAISITHPNGPDGPRDNMRFFHEDDVVCEDWKSYRALQSQLTEARAREAVAYEVAARACWKQKVYRDDQCNSSVSDIQRARWIAGSKQAEMMAQAIEDMRPDHTTTALEQIKADADKAGYERGIREVAKRLQDRMDQLDWEEGSYEWDTGVTNLPEWAETIWEECEAQRDAILATLSADTQD